MENMPWLHKGKILSAKKECAILELRSGKAQECEFGLDGGKVVTRGAWLVAGYGGLVARLGFLLHGGAIPGGWLLREDSKRFCVNLWERTPRGILGEGLDVHDVLPAHTLMKLESDFTLKDLMRNEPLLKCFIKLGTLGAMFFATKETQDHGLLMKDSLSQWIVERVKTIQLPFKLISPDPNCEKKFHSDAQCKSNSGKTGEEMSSS
ncbi:hypothetical protein LR48_Vigan02g104600 [Vigna angularis]|uniref:Uncharacterized protein n=1 Tax=Phaseolus angularis TaxID=3914 RepID=A0A0L9TWL4_PHAAN|nr:hypothetical protein LR48_Vigan02g104600 [Vigna angularis]